MIYFLFLLFAGVFVGVGLGIIFRYGGTTGGVDIIARLVHKYYGWSMGKTMLYLMRRYFIFLVNIFRFRSMMYTLVAVFIGARVIDFVQEGAYSASGAFIISEIQNEIADRITEEMDRGVTILRGMDILQK